MTKKTLFNTVLIAALFAAEMFAVAPRPAGSKWESPPPTARRGRFPTGWWRRLAVRTSLDDTIAAALEGSGVVCLAASVDILSGNGMLPRAIDQVDASLEAPAMFVLSEEPDYWPSLRAIVLAGKTSGPMVHDARVAAICMQHGVRELWSADRDFSRFPALSVRNPLAPQEG